VIRRNDLAFLRNEGVSSPETNAVYAIATKPSPCKYAPKCEFRLEHKRFHRSVGQNSAFLCSLIAVFCSIFGLSPSVEACDFDCFSLKSCWTPPHGARKEFSRSSLVRAGVAKVLVNQVRQLCRSGALRASDSLPGVIAWHRGAAPHKAKPTMHSGNLGVYCVMQETDSDFTRRRFLRSASLAAGFFTIPGAFAEELVRETPRITVGPLYPDKLPLDTDNDLIIVNDSLTPAVGEITHLSGRIFDARGTPIRDAVIEIWQVDSTATYLKERSSKKAGSFDANFQGFGRFLTGSNGEYYFRTIKPVPYPGRPAPHIHLMIRTKGREPWSTQLYIKGHPGNQRDGLYRSIGDAKAQEAVTVDFAPIKDSRIGELAAKFDIFLGFTPES